MRRLCAQMANRGGPSHILLAARCSTCVHRSRTPFALRHPYQLSSPLAHIPVSCILHDFLIPFPNPDFHRAPLIRACALALLRRFASRPDDLFPRRSDCIFIFSSSPHSPFLSLIFITTSSYLIPSFFRNFPTSPPLFRLETHAQILYI